MKLHLGQPLYSATDLLNFLGCTHASAMDIHVLGGTLEVPEGERDPYQEILKEKGMEHERRYLESLKAEGRSSVGIPDRGSIEERAELTRQAMRDGIDVIYQGALIAPSWHGYSDFLLKVEKPSALGAWSYEVADTKLARTAKPRHVMQLCVYSAIIEREQGVAPDNAHVMLGDGTQVSMRLRDYIHYCNRARERFEQFAAIGERTTIAEPCGHCEMCRWAERCEREWEDAGHLRLVAALGAAQARKLRLAGVGDMAALAALPDGTSIARLQSSTIEKLRTQARLQMEKRTSGRNRVEILPTEARRGFERLPQPNEGDLFFDIEGDPVYSQDGSLEYLFGFHYVEGGESRYEAIWARNRSEEKRAFEATLDFITARLSRYPDAFVYHYASYEQTVLRRLAKQYGSSSREEEALKRLAQSYGTRENEVDDLLRNHKLVDLYKVVREAIQTSEPAYSLKNLEVFFADERTQEIKGGGESIVAFENWLRTGDDKLLESIADYNEFDCVSTRLCRDWLISLKPEGTPWLDPEAEKDAKALEKEEERRQEDQYILALRANLTVNTIGEERRWRELLGCLLEYHRREARSEWWNFFKRLDPAHDHVADAESIGSLSVDPKHEPTPIKRSRIWRLRFPAQEFKLDVGDSPVRTDTGKGAGEIVAIDPEAGWLEIKIGNTQPGFAQSFALVPPGPMRDGSMRDALKRFAEAVFEDRGEEYAAVMSILRREKPRLRDSVIMRGDVLLEGTVDAIERMSDTHLVIQGPPGSGKTFTSAHAIVALLAKGRRVGVMSQSHKAINNLLKSVEAVAAREDVKFSGIKKSSEDDQRLNGQVITETGDNKEVFSGSHSLIGGTAWLFSCTEMDKQLDYLFIDEAGQVSLADVVACGLAARNIVLVGDQMQLPQVSKGQHPGGSGVSALEYLTGEWATVPKDRGIFLERTWRLHPALCRFVSDAFYESRLEPDVTTHGQMLDLESYEGGDLAPSGLRFIAVEHEDNSQQSEEEAERLDTTYRALLGLTWIDQKGERRPITADDILVVSPYNMQVNLLRRTLPPGARVGTVDKFQGQEAAVVLVSMASSDADLVPRGIDFLFSANRLNVALSRARCLSVMYCSPKLLDHVCTTLERMRLVNTVCWAKEYAEASAD